MVIGDNGGEDTWLLNAVDHSDMNIYEWQHWLDGDIVKMEYDFQSLLETSVSNLSTSQCSPIKNDDKSWCVQFSIRTNEEQKIYSTILLILVQEWEYKGTSPANVRSFEVRATLAQKDIIFRRLEYATWNSPMYCFDLKEPVSQYGLNSLIKDLDAKLKATSLDYKLIDYGILGLVDRTDI